MIMRGPGVAGTGGLGGGAGVALWALMLGAAGCCAGGTTVAAGGVAIGARGGIATAGGVT